LSEEELKEEEWEMIPKLELYGASSVGRICNNQSGDILPLFIDTTGYWKVCLFSRKWPKGRLCSVHELMAAAFLPLPVTPPGVKTPKWSVDHKDGIKTRNRLTNLQWATRSEQRRNQKRLQAPLTPARDRTPQEDLPGEKWAETTEEKEYGISNLGRVKTPKDLIKLGTLAQGVLHVQMCGKSYLVHRLVALAWIGASPPGLNVVRHINGQPLDNRVANLEWVHHEMPTRRRSTALDG
jgi:hypothetical protein